MFNRIKDGMYWDRAWKLVEGCTPVSEGCAHCWSARETHMRAKNPNATIAARNKGLTSKYNIKLGANTKSPFFNGRIRLRMDNLILPERIEKPTAFAVWNDLFHEDVPFDFIEMSLIAAMNEPMHTYFILTKRAERLLKFYQSHQNTIWWSSSNIWFGVTAENQEQADKRIPILLQTPAAKRYVSIEPMLGPIELLQAWPDKKEHPYPHGLDWIIAGGESGPGARPMHPDWARSLRDQCKLAGVPFFFKQWGEWSANYGGTPEKARAELVSHFAPEKSSCLKVWRVGKAAAGRILDGKEYLEVPKI